MGAFVNHVLYPVSSLPIRKTYECAAAEGEPYRAEELKSFGTLRAEPKCIKVYYELDYDNVVGVAVYDGNGDAVNEGCCWMKMVDIDASVDG